MIERHEFETLANRDLIPRLIASVQNVLTKAHIAPSDLTSIEVVGGGVRVPCVLKGLEDFFGKPMSKTCDGDESVARGAAWMCAMLSPTVKLATVFEVKDINMYPITIRWDNLDTNSETTTTMAIMPPPSSAPLPSSASSSSIATAASDSSDQLFSDAQPFPHLKIVSFSDRKAPFQLSAYYSDPTMLPSGANTLLGAFVVRGMPALDKPPTIKIRAKLNIHSLLQVTNAEMLEFLPLDSTNTPATSPRSASSVVNKDGNANNANENTDAMDESEDGNGATVSHKERQTGTSTPAPQNMTSEAPASGAASTDTEAQTKSDATTTTTAAAAASTAAVRKPKTKKTELKVDSHFTSGFDQKTLSSAFELESQMEHSDQVVRDTVLAKNNLEAYALDMRSRLDDELKDYFEPEQAKHFDTVLASTVDWIYDAGADVQKSDYKVKRDELVTIGDAAIARRNEAINRDGFVMALKVIQIKQTNNTHICAHTHTHTQIHKIIPNQSRLFE